jgi:aspartate kinase
VFHELENIFNGLTEILKEASFNNYDYYYDQIVSLGEILSTTIVSQYLVENDIPCNFLDARQVIFTNNSYRSAKVDMKKTSLAITQQVSSGKGIWISQGFIAHDEQEHTTTLGREGSDYSAAIFASVLNVDELTIWKDVDGVFNADPKIFQNVRLIEQLSYKDAVELAFYGASIIHPKTIRPLQEKGIILKVRSFYHLENKGTQVSNSSLPNLKNASLIVKKKQILLSLTPRDFSFMNVENMGVIFQLLSKHQFHINLIQNSAISFSLCVDENYAHFDALKNDLMEYYKLRYNKNQVLVTIRHYQPETIENIYAHLKIKIEQRNRSTYQILISEEEFEGKLIGILG